MTAPPLRDRLDRRFALLDQDRASWLADCRDIAEVILPTAGRFLSETPAEGDRRGRKIINATATMAHRTMAAGLMAGITSPARPWFRLSVFGDETENDEAKLWFDEVAKRMQHIMAQSNLYTSLHQVYAEEGAFGTAAMLVVGDSEKVIRVETLTAGEYYISVGPGGEPNGLFREFKMTVGQLVEEFGEENVSEAVKSMFKAGTVDRWRDVRAVIEKNDGRDEGRSDGKNKPWRSCYWEVGTDGDKFLRQSGYEEQPFMTPRWDVLLGASYGTGPGLIALGDARALQILEKNKAKAISKMIDPPFIAPASMRRQGVNLLPGGVNYLDGPADAFRPAYAVNLPIQYVAQEITSAENRIRQAFYADLFLMLSRHEGQMTAREVAERENEKLLALGPMLNRQHPELLDPLIERVYGIMLRGGLLPPPPESISGQNIKIQYISVLAQAQGAVDLTGIERVVGLAGNMAAVKPEVLDNIDADSIIRTYGSKMGAPTSMFVPTRAVEERRSARAQQQQQQQKMEMMEKIAPAAQQGADAARLLAETQTGAGANALQMIMGGGQ